MAFYFQMIGFILVFGCHAVRINILGTVRDQSIRKALVQELPQCISLTRVEFRPYQWKKLGPYPPFKPLSE